MRIKTFSRIILVSLSLAVSGCKPIEPTYTKENFAVSIKKICKDEYGIDNVQTWLKGETIWIYTPQDKLLNENMELDKEILEKINKVVISLSRVVLSLKPRPEFYVLIASDIKDRGTDLINLGYVHDIVKFQLQTISRSEFGRRNVYDIRFNPSALSDKIGKHIFPYDISMEEFLSLQITQRINLKFKEDDFEVKGVECFFKEDTFNLKYDIKKTGREDDIDADKEILKIISLVLKAYAFRDYSLLRINNLNSNQSSILSRAAFEGITEEIEK